MAKDELVSVVVPAFNAEKTLGETLTSVRRQSYRNLEILVVNDGSTDNTAGVAARHAAEDARVRVLSIENGGVAVARNTGIAASRGAFIAPVDADDLWHPEKIARQMALIRHQPDVGYVYTFDRKIDGDGRVLVNRGESHFEGEVYLRLILFNFIGNGSSLLIRRAALEEVGGYDPTLHRRGAQGCEDYLLQILIARRWKVARVPEYLTGYRKSPGSMSWDTERMVRSRCIMLEHVARRFPETPKDLLAANEAMVRARLAVAFMHARRPGAALDEFRRALRLDPVAALTVGRMVGFITLRGILRRSLVGLVRHSAAAVLAPRRRPHFFDLDPPEGRRPRDRHALERRLDLLAEQEAAFFAPAEDLDECRGTGRRTTPPKMGVSSRADVKLVRR